MARSIDTDDYTLALEAVVRVERQREETPAEKVQGFVMWALRNPEAIRELERKALELAERVRYVSPGYLFGYLRNEAPVKIYDADGGTIEGQFKAPNIYQTIFSRYLLERHPELKGALRTNRSRFDGVELPPIDWSGRRKGEC